MESNRYSSRASQIKIYFGKLCREFLLKEGWKSMVTAFIIILLLSFTMGDNIFKKDTSTRTGMFILLCACIWNGVFNSIESICRERDIIKHEHRSGMYLSAYIMAHAEFEFLICLGESVITWLLLVIRYRENIAEAGYAVPRCIAYFVTILLVTAAADAMGIMISSIVKSTNTAMKVMPFVLIIEMAFANVLLEIPGKLGLISWLTISRWGSDAIRTIAFTRDAIESGNRRLELMNLPHDYPAHFALCWLVLAVFILVSLCIAMLALRSVDRDQR